MSIFQPCALHQQKHKFKSVRKQPLPFFKVNYSSKELRNHFNSQLVFLKYIFHAKGKYYC